MSRGQNKSRFHLFDSVRYYAAGLYRRFNEENILFLSSGIAFNGILCLLPFMLLLTSLLGIFLHSSHFQVQKLDDMLNAVFPAEPYARQIRNAIKVAVFDIIRYRSAFGYYGIGVLLWTAASLFSAIRIVVNRIYKIKSSKTIIVTAIENIVFVIILGSLFIVANAFTWMLTFIDSFLKQIPAFEGVNLTVYAKTVSFAGSYVSALVMFYIVNRFIPGKEVSSKVASVAAITAATLWWIAGKGFAWYLAAFPSYKTLYGTYAFLLVFLVWIYYSSTVFIIGVICGQLYRERALDPKLPVNG